MPGMKDKFKNLFSNPKKTGKDEPQTFEPMPSQEIVDQRFEELVENISMPEKALDKMREMTAENKWLMICQYERKINFESPGEWVKILKTPTNESTLQKLRVVVTGVDVKWMKSFHEKDGLFYLVSKNLSPSARDSETVACLRVVRSFMNSNFGLKAMTNCPKVMDYFRFPLRSSDEEALLLVLDLLTVISWISVEGHKSVVEVLERNRDETKAKSIYSPAMAVLEGEFPDSTKTSAMTFANAMVNSIHDIEERNHNRKFLLDEGILEIIAKIKSSPEKYGEEDRFILNNQFAIFEKEIENDRKESKLLDINLSDPQSVWSFLLESSRESGQSAYLVDLLRFLVVIPNVRRLGQYIWENCHHALFIATSFVINDNDVNEMESNLDKIDENVDIKEIVQKSFTKNYRLLKYDEIDKLMKKASTVNKAEALSSSTDESLRKEFHNYKIQKEAEIDQLRKDLAEKAAAPAPSAAAPSAAPPSDALPMAADTALPPALETGSGAAPPPLALGTGAAPPPLALGGGAAPPPLSLGSAGGPPPLGGIGGPPPLGLGAPAASYLPPKANPPPKTKMKNLHWNSLPVNKIEGTVWDDIKDDSIKLNSAEFEDMFRAKASVKPKVGGAPKKARKEKVQLVDSKRSTNVEIALSRFKMTPEAIRDAILAMDKGVLTADRIGKLLSLVPTNEEAETCGAYDGNVAELGVAEKFFRVVSTINNISRRLEAFLFQQQFENEFDALMNEIKMVEKAAKEIKSNANLKSFLSVILRAGNHMNGGTKKGGVYGFKLATLRQLNSTKSTDNKVTLMQYIVFYMSREHPGALKIVQEMDFLDGVVKIESQNLQAKVNKMKANLNKINTMLKKAKDDPKDRFKAVMGSFYESAANKAAQMHKAMTAINELTQDLIAKYSEDSSKMKWEEFFAIINNFVFSIKSGVIFWKKREEQEEKERKKQQFAAESKKRAARMKEKKRQSSATSSSGATENVLNNLKKAQGDVFSQEIQRRRNLSGEK